MAAKTSAKKTTKKKATTKKAATTKKKATTKKAAVKKTSAKKDEEAPAKTAVASTEKKAEDKPKDGVSSTSVNLGHVFSLRPRVTKSYRQADFITAKQLLQDETYSNVQEAARAVVEKALELTHKGSPMQRSKRR